MSKKTQKEKNDTDYESEKKSYIQKIQSFLNNTLDPYKPIIIGKTPKALTLAGASEENNLTINISTLKKCMGDESKVYHGHNLSREIIEDLPDELRNPIMILKGNQPNSIVLITSLVDSKSRGIMVSIEIGAMHSFYSINKITSIYGRNNLKNYIEKQINTDNLIALNKEKADNMLHSLGLQSPQENTYISYDDSITYTLENVNYPNKNQWIEGYVQLTSENAVLTNVEIVDTINSDMEYAGYMELTNGEEYVEVYTDEEGGYHGLIKALDNDPELASILSKYESYMDYLDDKIGTGNDERNFLFTKEESFKVRELLSELKKQLNENPDGVIAMIPQFMVEPNPNEIVGTQLWNEFWNTLETYGFTGDSKLNKKEMSIVNSDANRRQAFSIMQDVIKYFDNRLYYTTYKENDKIVNQGIIETLSKSYDIEKYISQETPVPENVETITHNYEDMPSQYDMPSYSAPDMTLEQIEGSYGSVAEYNRTMSEKNFIPDETKENVLETYQKELEAFKIEPSDYAKEQKANLEALKGNDYREAKKNTIEEIAKMYGLTETESLRDELKTGQMAIDVEYQISSRIYHKQYVNIEYDTFLKAFNDLHYLGFYPTAYYLDANNKRHYISNTSVEELQYREFKSWGIYEDKNTINALKKEEKEVSKRIMQQEAEYVQETIEAEEEYAKEQVEAEEQKIKQEIKEERSETMDIQSKMIDFIVIDFGLLCVNEEYTNNPFQYFPNLEKESTNYSSFNDFIKAFENDLKNGLHLTELLNGAKQAYDTMLKDFNNFMKTEHSSETEREKEMKLEVVKELIDCVTKIQEIHMQELEGTPEAFLQNNISTPVVTIEWSEHHDPKLQSGSKLSITEANNLFEKIDTEVHSTKELQEEGMQYYKTKFVIDYTTPDGENHQYEGRYDIGDGDGTLTDHIRYYSPKLADYLESFEDKTIPNTFITIESTNDFTDYDTDFKPTFENNRLHHKFRLVTIGKKGFIEPVNEAIFNSYKDALANIPPEYENAKFINYDEMVKEASTAIYKLSQNITNDTNNDNKKRFFVDLDGTCALWNPVAEEELYEQGYYRNLAPYENVVQAINDIAGNNPEVEVYVLSKYLTGSKYALTEKKEWVKEHLPNIDTEHQIFVPANVSKKDMIPNGLKETDYLLDDFTNNFDGWQPPAKAIKVLNGINNTKGTWKDNKLSVFRDPDSFKQAVLSIINNGETIVDLPPQQDANIDIEAYYNERQGYAYQNFAENHEKKLHEKESQYNGRKTLVINAFGGAGAGKTTACMDICQQLKKQGYNAEYVPEYCKDLVYENSDLLNGTSKNQFKILQEQMRRIDRLIGQVDFIVTDSPILLNSVYNKELTPEYEEMVSTLFKQYDNFTFIVERDPEAYQQEGRIHTLEESKEKDAQIEDMLRKNELYYGKYNHSTISKVVNNSIRTFDRITKEAKEADLESETSKEQESQEPEAVKEENGTITLHIKYNEPINANGFTVENDEITFNDLESVEAYARGEVVYDVLDNTQHKTDKETLLYAENESGEIVWGSRESEKSTLINNLKVTTIGHTGFDNDPEPINDYSLDELDSVIKDFQNGTIDGIGITFTNQEQERRDYEIYTNKAHRGNVIDAGLTIGYEDGKAIRLSDLEEMKPIIQKLYDSFPEIEFVEQNYSERMPVNEYLSTTESASTPEYAFVELYDSDALYYDNDIKPFARAKVSIAERISEVGYNGVRLDILEAENLVENRNPKLYFGNYYTCDTRHYKIIRELDEQELNTCKELHKEFKELHENSPYEITGCIYDTTPKYADWDKDHSYPEYDLIESVTFRDAGIPKSLDGAEKWLLENHPSYYFGANIHQNCPSGNFSAFAVPSYYESEYKTTDRKAILEQIAKDKGVSLGIFEEPKQTNNGELIMIDTNQCTQIDKWVAGESLHNGNIILGNLVEDPTFYYASIGNAIAEFDKKPTREEVEDYFLNEISQTYLDLRETGLNDAEANEDIHNQIVPATTSEIQWHIIHECDLDDGTPTLWSTTVDGQVFYIDKLSNGIDATLGENYGVTTDTSSLDVDFELVQAKTGDLYLGLFETLSQAKEFVDEELTNRPKVNTISEVQSMDEKRLLDSISNIAYDEDGYIHFTIESFDGYELEGLYRVSDPENGEPNKLVSIDYGDRHEEIKTNWKNIEKKLTEISKENINERSNNMARPKNIVNLALNRIMFGTSATYKPDMEIAEFEYILNLQFGNSGFAELFKSEFENYRNTGNESVRFKEMCRVIANTDNLSAIMERNGIATVDEFNQDNVCIYQIIDNPKMHYLAYSDYKSATETGLKPEYYVLVQSEERENRSLDKIYADMQGNRKNKQGMHSLSVSDVIGVWEDGKRHLYYVDSFGFTELQDFDMFKSLTYLTPQEQLEHSVFAEITELRTNDANIELDGAYRNTTWHVLEENTINDKKYLMLESNDADFDVTKVICDMYGNVILDNYANIEEERPNLTWNDLESLFNESMLSDTDTIKAIENVPATENQIKFATNIAETLNIDLPSENSKKEYSNFIRTNKKAFYEASKDNGITTEMRKTAENISKGLKIALPEEQTASAYNAFIEENKQKFLEIPKNARQELSQMQTDQASEKQIKYAEKIAKQLGVELPKGNTKAEYSYFINKHQNNYKQALKNNNEPTTPATLLSETEYMAMVEKDPKNIGKVPKEARSNEIIKKSLEKYGAGLRYLDDDEITKERALVAVMQYGSSLRYVPPAIRDLDVCTQAYISDIRCLNDIPKELRSAVKEEYKKFVRESEPINPNDNSPLDVRALQEKGEQWSEEIKSMIDNGLDNPDALMEAIAFGSKFYQYSILNMELMSRQNRGIQYVGTVKHFEKLGYHVNANEQPMFARIPLFSNYVRDPENPNKKIYKKDYTKEIIKAIKNNEIQEYSYVSGFMFQYAFYDISQTDCPVEDYPSLFNMGYTSEMHSQLYDAMKQFAENSLGFTVEKENFRSIALRGTCQPDNKIIKINQLLQDSEALGTLAHEIGHGIMHTINEASNKSTPQKEVEADILSIMLQSNLGLEITDVRKRHLISNFKELQAEAELRGETVSMLKIVDFVQSKVFRKYAEQINDYIRKNIGQEQIVTETAFDLVREKAYYDVVYLGGVESDPEILSAIVPEYNVTTQEKYEDEYANKFEYEQYKNIVVPKISVLKPNLQFLKENGLYATMSYSEYMDWMKENKMNLSEVISDYDIMNVETLDEKDTVKDSNGKSVNRIINDIVTNADSMNIDEFSFSVTEGNIIAITENSYTASKLYYVTNDGLVAMPDVNLSALQERKINATYDVNTEFANLSLIGRYLNLTDEAQQRINYLQEYYDLDSAKTYYGKKINSNQREISPEAVEQINYINDLLTTICRYETNYSVDPSSKLTIGFGSTYEGLMPMMSGNVRKIQDLENAYSNIMNYSQMSEKVKYYAPVISDTLGYQLATLELDKNYNITVTFLEDSFDSLEETKDFYEEIATGKTHLLPTYEGDCYTEEDLKDLKTYIFEQIHEQEPNRHLEDTTMASHLISLIKDNIMTEDEAFKETLNIAINEDDILNRRPEDNVLLNSLQDIYKMMDTPEKESAFQNFLLNTSTSQDVLPTIETSDIIVNTKDELSHITIPENTDLAKAVNEIVHVLDKNIKHEPVSKIDFHNLKTSIKEAMLCIETSSDMLPCKPEFAQREALEYVYDTTIPTLDLGHIYAFHPNEDGILQAYTVTCDGYIEPALPMTASEMKMSEYTAVLNMALYEVSYDDLVKEAKTIQNNIKINDVAKMSYPYVEITSSESPYFTTSQKLKISDMNTAVNRYNTELKNRYKDSDPYYNEKITYTIHIDASSRSDISSNIYLGQENEPFLSGMLNRFAEHYQSLIDTKKEDLVFNADTSRAYMNMNLSYIAKDCYEGILDKYVNNSLTPVKERYTELKQKMVDCPDGVDSPEFKALTKERFGIKKDIEKMEELRFKAKDALKKMNFDLKENELSTSEQVKKLLDAGKDVEKILSLNNISNFSQEVINMAQQKLQQEHLKKMQEQRQQGMNPEIK